MARDEAPVFVRGGTYYGVAPQYFPSANEIADTQNIEGKLYRFEPNSADGQQSGDPAGRYILCRCVRNSSGVFLKPGRLVKYLIDGSCPIETRIAGYCYQLSDIPAGVVDEFLPSAGVAPNDLFWIVIDGSSKCVNAASPTTFAVGDVLVPAATGASATDDLAGRVAKQDLTGSAATLGNNLQNRVGRSDAAASLANGMFVSMVHLEFSPK